MSTIGIEREALWTGSAVCTPLQQRALHLNTTPNLGKIPRVKLTLLEEYFLDGFWETIFFGLKYNAPATIFEYSASIKHSTCGAMFGGRR